MKEELKWWFKNNPEYSHLSNDELEEIYSDIDRLFYSYQPERLSERDHIEENLEMVSDSPNSGNK